jgi:WD40 repeat protein
VETGKTVAEFQPKWKDPFYAVAFSPDGTLLAAVGDDRKAHILSGSDLSPQSEQELSNYALFAVAFHPKSNLSTIAGEDGKIYLLPELP